MLFLNLTTSGFFSQSDFGRDRNYKNFVVDIKSCPSLVVTNPVHHVKVHKVSQCVKEFSAAFKG